jgi:hypothetical protein
MSVLYTVQTAIYTIENNFFIQTVNKRQVRDTFTSYCTVNSLFISTDRRGHEQAGSAQVEYCASWVRTFIRVRVYMYKVVQLKSRLQHT